MSDYIKREDVVKRLSRVFLLQAPTARAIVEAIPAADVVERELYERALSDVIDLSMKQKTGKWISMMGHSVCNVCGYKGSPILTNFCPNCGARMVTNDV